jgi:hypothetical protein
VPAELLDGHQVLHGRDPQLRDQFAWRQRSARQRICRITGTRSGIPVAGGGLVGGGCDRCHQEREPAVGGQDPSAGGLEGLHHSTAQHHFWPTNHTGNPIQRGHYISGVLVLVHKSAPAARQTRRSQPYNDAEPITVIKVRLSRRAGRRRIARSPVWCKRCLTCAAGRQVGPPACRHLKDPPPRSRS